MSSDDSTPNVDLPVAVYALKDERDDKGWKFETLNRFEEYEENQTAEDFKAPAFVLGRDAAEAVQEARQQERRRILNKIEEMKKEARITKLNAPDVRKTLNQLRDDLKEEDQENTQEEVDA